MLLTCLFLVPELLWPMLDTHTPPWLTARDPPMPNPRLMLLTLAMVILMLTPVSPSDLALVWTQSPRDLTPPLRDMFLTTDTDITPTVTTTERGPLMLRLMLRLIPRLSMATTATLTVWDTTWAMLDTATLATPLLMVGSLPPMLPLATPLPTLPEE